ncbi:hypothetical protein D3C76_1026650 [compost metagenome]
MCEDPQPEQQDLVGPPKEHNVVNTRGWDELWNAKEDCRHNVVLQPGGGVKCTECGGWCCY